MAAISQMIFSDAFSWMKSFIFDSNFPEVCSQGSNRQYNSMGLDDGLAPNRRQPIIWTNVERIHWDIYAAQRGVELALEVPALYTFYT